MRIDEKVFVLLPVYNEERYIAACLHRARQAFPAATIVVIDNNSTDQSATVARNLGFTVITETAKGKGHAISTGVKLALAQGCQWVAFHDADNEYDATHLAELVAACQSASLGVSTRAVMGVGLREVCLGTVHWRSLVANYVARLALKLATKKSPPPDILTGARVLSAELALRTFSREDGKSPFNGFELETALTKQALDLNAQLIYTPVRYIPRATGEKKIKAWDMVPILRQLGATMAGSDAANLDAMSAAAAYQLAMQRLVATQLGLTGRTGLLLDFGAGRGDYAVALQRTTSMQVQCFEPDTTLHPSFPPSMPPLEDLAAIADASLSAVYSLNVFEHILDDTAALKRLLLKCKPGADIFILVPANPALWSDMDRLVGHYRRYTPESLRKLSLAAGASIVREGWFDKTGYFATKAYKALRIEKSGVVTRQQVTAFDRVFRYVEPILQKMPIEFGKNRWILLKKPPVDIHPLSE